MKSTSRALAFASRWFEPALVARVFEPLVADWQREWQDASGLRRWSVWVRGLTAFACAALVSSHHVVRQPTPSSVSNRIVTRIARFTLLVTPLMTLPYLSQSQSIGLFALFVIPSNLVLAFPFAMISAVDAVRRDHTLPQHVERATIIKLGIAAILFMIVFGGFVVPAANQAFRAGAYERSLRAQGFDATRIARINPGRSVPRRGVRELSTYELVTDHGFTDGSRFLPEYVGRELSRRASLAVLPLVLLWLRWRMLDRTPGRWLPLPAPLVAVIAFASYGYLWDSLGMDVWAPHMIVATLLAFDSWWVTRRSAIA